MTATVATTLALPVASIVERVGAYVGFVALLGLAILALLYFSQARDVRRLREWAGRAPERAAELEGRATAPAQTQTVIRKAATPPATAAAAAPALGAGQAPAAQTAAGKAAAGSSTIGGQPAGDAATTDVPTETGEHDEASEEVAGIAASNGDGGDTGEHEDVVPDTGIAAIADQPTVAHPTISDAELEPLDPGDEGLEPLEPIAPEDYLPASSYATAGARRESAGQRHIPQARYIVAAVAIFAVLVFALGSVTGLIGGDDSGDSGSNKSAQKSGQQGNASKTAPANIDPSQVTVAVLNGTTVTGLAFRVSQEAKTGGFVLGNVTNAATTDQLKTEVLYAPGQKNAARAIASKLGISSVAPVDSVNSEIAGSADAVVLVGADRSE